MNLPHKCDHSTIQISDLGRKYLIKFAVCQKKTPSLTDVLFLFLTAVKKKINKNLDTIEKIQGHVFFISLDCSVSWEISWLD